MKTCMIAGSELRIDADANGPAGTTLTQSFDGTDGITVNPNMGIALQLSCKSCLIPVDAAK